MEILCTYSKIFKRRFAMNEANYSIKCSVNRCKHHCKDEDFCSLAKIQVGERCQSNSDQCFTDCESFCRK